MTGMWQVYERIRGTWAPIGPPEPKDKALERVKLIESEIPTYLERERRWPHAVPI